MASAVSLAVLGAVLAVPSAGAEPPPACAGLVAQLSASVKKVVDGAVAEPPQGKAVAEALGDALGLLTAMQGARCLPLPPVSAPPPAGEAFAGPELCASGAMASFAGVYSVLAKVVPGAVAPDPGKLKNEVSGVLKTLNDLLSHCALPPPEGGLPTMPAPPA
ncbi:hypothetical protein [Saccharothrix sp. Mg75]|uniref:hypothetical protein n=1 Tax=Saccharothrix sp. Mg75 TaxID=3445357 RepID=UPI003EEC9375